jgi:hypothetical protein
VVPNLKEYMNKTLQINGFSYSFYSAKCKEWSICDFQQPWLEV